MQTHAPHDGPTLFLPGAGGRRAFWEPVASRLAHGHPHLFFPWPGFGDASPVPSIGSLDDLYAWWLTQIPAGAVNVVAQSMGCVLAMRFAIEQPARVRRLVLTGGSGGTRARLGVDWRPAYRAEMANVPDWFEKDRTELDERLGAIRAPTLLLYGSADPIAPVAMGEHLRARIAGARLVVIEGGSHAFAEERAEEVARVIEAHLA
jgi:pimeloyl-ACP methyl ester carboxylesterase